MASAVDLAKTYFRICSNVKPIRRAHFLEVVVVENYPEFCISGCNRMLYPYIENVTALSYTNERVQKL